ncbi:MAG: hypothetical protein NTZ13_03435 [Candidatus Parcubacteria bacterium]|nr:hypothetical protein [Candidatus Parcubacteria bacterium]
MGKYEYDLEKDLSEEKDDRQKNNYPDGHMVATFGIGVVLLFIFVLWAFSLCSVGLASELFLSVTPLFIILSILAALLFMMFLPYYLYKKAVSWWNSE